MREIRKPDFQADEGGWVDPEFFPFALRSELTLHLTSAPLSEAEKTNLINFAAEIAQMLFDDPLLPHKQIVEELRTVESNARRLLASLNTLSPQSTEAIHINAKPMAFGAFRDLPIAQRVRQNVGADDGLLGSAWDWIAALELIADKAASQYTLDRQAKPEQLRARGYVTLLAERVRGMTGVLPPKDRSAWFAAFAGRIGQSVGYEIGPRMVASGIEQATTPAR